MNKTSQHTKGIEAGEQWEVVNMDTEPIIRVKDSSPGFHPGYPQTVCKVFRYGAERPTEARAALIASAPLTASKLEKAEALNAELVEALKFYADEKNYKMGTDWVFDGNDEVGVDCESPADIEKGAKARAALAHSEKERT